MQRAITTPEHRKGIPADCMETRWTIAASEYAFALGATVKVELLANHWKD